MPSPLDMSLDDVIKTKPSGKQGAGTRGGRGSRNRGQAEKAPPPKVAAATTQAPVNSSIARRHDSVSGGSKPPGSGGLASALKAAVAAAAKATASADTKAPSRGKVLPQRQVSASVRDNGRAKQPVAASGTQAVDFSEKLQMSLDDVIKTDVKRGKPKADKPEATPKSVETRKSLAGQAAATKRKRGGRRIRLRLRGRDRQATIAAYAEPPRKGKAKAKAGARSKAIEQKAWIEDGSWSKDWDDRTIRDVYVGRTNEDRKRRPLAEMQEPEKRRRVGNKATPGWVDAYNRQRERERAERIARIESLGRGRADRLGGSGMRSADQADGGVWTRVPEPVSSRGLGREQRNVMKAPRTSSISGGSHGKVIRVSNVPKALDEQDIRDAFEDVGNVLKCSVERGVAIIKFDTPNAAKKAVNTFDRGELNGQTIYVAYEA